MRQKVQPGMNLDFVTPEELARHFQDHTETILDALGRNAQFKKVNFQTQADATGTVNNFKMPVPDGFMWMLMGYIINSANSPNTTKWNLYFNEAIQQNIIGQFTNAQASLNTVPARTVIVKSGEALALGTAAINAANDLVNITLLVVEVPLAHEAQLLM